MANTVYENFVLEARFTDYLNTRLNTRNLMTIDNSLVGEEGMVKKVNTYTYTVGTVEKLTKGQKNSTRGQIGVSTQPYTIELCQEVFDYHDEEFLQDENVLEMGMRGAGQLMVNYMNDKYFEELAKAETQHQYEGEFNYDVVVDAIAKMNIEDESGLFLIIGTDLKAVVRKDADFKSARQGEILFNGQIGNIAGVPVLVSKKVTGKKAFLATKEAVTCFTKRETEIEQARDAEARKNTVIMRKINLIALTDNTKVVKIEPSSPEVASVKAK